MSTRIGNHQRFAHLGPGDQVIGNYNIIEGGRGYKVVGNHNHCYGACLTVTGNHNYVEGSDCVITGNHNKSVGRRMSTTGSFVQHTNRDSAHGLPEKPDDAPDGTVMSMFIGSGGVTFQRFETAARSSPAVVLGDFIVNPPAPPPAITYPTGGDHAPKELEAPCVVCLDSARATIAIPCGHIYSCITCLAVARPTTCAICRQPVEKFIKIHEA